MQVYRDGKEVKNFQVRYKQDGNIERIANLDTGGVWEDVSLFEVKEQKPKKVTRTAKHPKTKKKAGIISKLKRNK